MKKVPNADIQPTGLQGPGWGSSAASWLATLPFLVTLGCIEPNRPTAPPDTTITTDAAPPDVEEVPPECVVAGDGVCEQLDSDCATFTCIGGRCVAEHQEGFCEAAPSCGPGTEAFCLSGACYQDNDGCSATPVDGCHKAMCGGPEGTCSAAPIGGAPCVGDEAAGEGLCSLGRLNPVDICTDAGQCQTRIADPSEVLPDTGTLVDTRWWISASRPAGLLVTERLRAGSFSFLGTGTWSVEPFGGSWFGTVREPRRGAWCLDSAGTLALAFGEGPADGATPAANFLASYARDANVIVGAGLNNAEILIGTELGGTAIEVDGPYSVLMTWTSAEGDQKTHIGTMTFELGKLVDEDALVGVGNSLISFHAQTTFFASTNNDGIASAVLDFTDEDGLRLNKTLVGAISPGGATVVLNFGQRENNLLGLGLMVLVRYGGDTGVLAATTDRGWWNTVLQVAPLGSINGVGSTSVVATMMTRGETIMGGFFGQDSAPWESTNATGRITDGSLAINRFGEIGLDVPVASMRRRFGGFASAKRDFGILFDAGRAVWTDPTTIPDEPQSPTFGFIVKRYETFVTAE